MPADKVNFSAGVITYVYFFLASHVLSKFDYGQITVLWSAVFIVISTLYRPVEQDVAPHVPTAQILCTTG
jgi:hypothetical protein